ncbi:MAG: hypothetical protein KIT25_11245 [Enhydrobacter sp.]|nr:MAG: hypothetical protein KIT25_11245 [Enhydrobacter sp.]
MPGSGVIVKNAEESSLVKRTYRVVERIIVVALVVIAVPVVVVAMRLMAGPVDLDFLRGHFPNQFDSPGGKMRVEAERIYAEWGALREPMRLVFVGVQVLDADRQQVATAPSIALSFEPRSVVRGRFLPTAIVVDRPTLSLDIAREGGMLRRILASDGGGGQDRAVDLLVERLMAEPNYASILGQLDAVRVERARVTVRDVPSGIAWLAQDARANLTRGAGGVNIAADATFSNGGDPVEVSLSGTYARDRSRISAEAKVDGIKPSMMADLSPDVALLRGVDIALSGRLSIEADGAGTIRAVTIDVTGGNGTLSLPGVLPRAHKVHSVNAHASIDAGAHRSRIDHIDIDLGIAKLSITGNGAKTEKGQEFAGRAELRNISIDRLDDYWPLQFAEGGRRWALANLSGGSLDIAAEFGLSAPGNDIAQLAVTKAVGFLDYRGMQVRYMPHMPELEDVWGTARFEGGTLRFIVSGGTAVGLRLDGATIDLTGLDGPLPHMAALRLAISGDSATVMALLARRQLGLPKDATLDPKRLAGSTAIDLQLSFPLIEALTVAEIAITADADMTNFSLRDAIGDVDLSDTTGHVRYAGAELVVTGRGKLDGNPAEISWRNLFGEKVPYRHRYEVKGTFPASMLVKAGLPSPEPYVAGPVSTNVVYQVQPNGTGEVIGRFDLKAAQVSVSELAWGKEPGVDGQLAATIKLVPGGKVTSLEFDGRGGGLAAKGQARFADGGAIQQLSLSQFALGRSDIAFDWKRAAGAVDVALSGRSLELSRVRQALKARDDVARAEPGGAASAGQASTRLSIQIGQLLLQRGALGSVSGKLNMTGDRVAAADLALSAGKGSAFRVTPAGGQRRALAIYVPDFGQFLQEAGWLDGLVGPFLNIQGQFDDAQADSPLTGTLTLGPYRLERVATPRSGVGTVNSMIDGLSRAGNALQQFTGLEAKLSKVGDRIEIRDGRTSGQSIGLTATGTIDLASETAQLRGVVVPGFALNNLLSNVPLLGPLLTGGKDGGVFAISYRLEGPLDDLKTNINMMSAVTPGALRELFNSSGPPPDADARPEQILPAPVAP